MILHESPIGMIGVLWKLVKAVNRVEIQRVLLNTANDLVQN